MESMVNEKTVHQVIRWANHPALDPVVRDVQEVIDQSTGIDSVLLEIRERHPSRPVFYYARHAVSHRSVITGSVIRIGTRSTIRVPGPGMVTVLVVASSPLRTSGSAMLSTLYPYVMFSKTPPTVGRQHKSVSSSLQEDTLRTESARTSA